MTYQTTSIGAELERVLGSDKCVLGTDLPVYRYSVSRQGSEPLLGVVYPEDTEDLVEVMRWSRANSIPVTPWSGGTSYSGGVVPVRGGVIVDLQRMNRLLTVDPENLVATAEPAIVLKTLDQKLRDYGVTLGHEPDSWFASTLGGACSTNGIGHRSAIDLLTSQVLGVEAVLPDGTVINTRPVWKSSTGKETLNYLFLGMEGSFGIITKITVRLRLLPEKESIAIFGYPDFQSAARAGWEIIRQGIVPQGLYVIEENRAKALVGELEPGTGAILCAYLGGTERMVRAQQEDIVSLCSSAGSELPSVADRWMLKRHYYVRAGRRLGGIVTGTLVSFPRFDDFLTMYDRFRELSKKWDFDKTYLGAMLYFGRSWMAMSLLIGTNPWDPTANERLEQWEEEMIQTQLALGGTADAITSVGLWRGKYMEAEHGTGQSLLRSIKQLVDPEGLLNSGKRGLS